MLKYLISNSDYLEQNISPWWVSHPALFAPNKARLAQHQQTAICKDISSLCIQTTGCQNSNNPYALTDLQQHCCVSFIPTRFYASVVCAMALCPSVCHKWKCYENCRWIRVSPKIKVLPSGTLNLADFLHFSPWHVEHRKYCPHSSTNNRHQFITLSIHHCLNDNGHTAAHRIGFSATAKTCISLIFFKCINMCMFV